MVFTECGISAIIHKNTRPDHIILKSLRDLQHRGREAFGISYMNTYGKIIVKKKKGMVTEIEELNGISSKCWLGHVRYSTTGNKEDNGIDKFMESCQPIFGVSSILNQYSIAHNGNIPRYIWENICKLYEDFSPNLNTYQSDTLLLRDFIEYLAQEDYNNQQYLNIKDSQISIWKNILITLMDVIPGACCLVIQTVDGFWVLRDRYGIRPLVMKEITDGILVASESVAFDSDDGIIKNIEAGQILYISNETARVEFQYKYYDTNPKHCVFEYLYFLRCNTTVNNLNITNFRMQVGSSLKDQITNSFPDLIDRWREGETVICGVPTSGVVFGKGFAEAIDLPYEQVLNKRDDYPWRTFILGSNDKRIQACEKKYIITSENMRNKILVLVDDSIVRGNTLTYLIKYIRMTSEPKEIHIISGSPPIKYPCRYGVDFPDIEELFANRVDIADMPKRLNVESVTYFDVDNLLKLESNVCHACFTGDYMF